MMPVNARSSSTTETETEDFFAFLEREKLAGAQALMRTASLARTSGQSLADVMTRTGLLTEQDLARAYGQFTGADHASLQQLPETPLFADEINVNFLRRNRILPLHDDSGNLVIAMADPLNMAALNAMTCFAGKTVRPMVAPLSRIDEAIDTLYGASGGNSSLTDDPEIDDPDWSGSEDIDRLRDLASGAPVIRMVNRIINSAVDAGATDIHIEPLQDRLRVRHRLDGVLHDADAPSLSQGPAIISRIKILANLDIAERRLSQDGRLRLSIRGQNVDFRVSTIPATHGESVVLRILDQSRQVLSFDALGFDGDNLRKLQSLLAEPYGIFLVTGPTGSGKTTTLYTSLSQLNTETTKILTVEDPVEYMLEGINQVQVQPAIGLTFANALRSFLRQDPDVLMVGEIRDHETAQVSIQAALTGHLVLSTLHTNDAVSALTRLSDMGIEDYLIASTVLGILGQRLVRRICPSCKESYNPDAHTRTLLESRGISNITTLSRGQGCSACRQTGFSGRIAIAEILIMNDEIRQLTVQSADAGRLKEAATQHGFRTMFEDGMEKALSGETTIGEVLRVTRDA